MVAVEKVKAAEGKFQLVKDDKRNPVYVDQYGNEHDAYTEDLVDYFNSKVLGRIEDIFAFVEGEATLQEVHHICRLLISDASKKMEQVCNLLEEKFGDIEVHALRKGFPLTDEDLPMGVALNADPKPETEKEDSVEKVKDDFKGFPSLTTLIEALAKGLLHVAIGAAKDLIKEIEKKQAAEGEQS
ncbi:MAG: hypothetical protein C4576_09210 [Desulfobacteraceae bacterium]|nr:MAG: hypothetical protein C4576_09210 [Desulfobacteraceae bacterium]